MSDDWKNAALDAHERERAEIRRRLAGEATPIERAQYVREPEPVATALNPLFALAQRFKLRMAKTVCEGFSENVSRCYSLTERDCPERASPCCPKRIAEFEAKLAKRNGSTRDLADIYAGFGIPLEIARLIAHGTLEQTPALTIAERWWQSSPRPRVLVLNGYSQIGKSVAAAALVARWRGLFVHVPTEFCHKLIDNAFQQSLLTPSLLVFDDVGLESPNSLVVAKFDGVFCARVDGGRFTVITTNSAGDIRARYGDRVAERVLRHGLAVNIAEAA